MLPQNGVSGAHQGILWPFITAECNRGTSFHIKSFRQDMDSTGFTWVSIWLQQRVGKEVQEEVKNQSMSIIKSCKSRWLFNSGFKADWPNALVTRPNTAPLLHENSCVHLIDFRKKDRTSIFFRQVQEGKANYGCRHIQNKLIHA